VAAASAAAASVLSARLPVFVAPLPRRPAPPVHRHFGTAAGTAVAAAPPTRTAAEEQEIADKLDDVLRDKFGAKEEKPELSPWAQRAVDAATGKGEDKDQEAKRDEKAKRKPAKSKSRKIIKSLDEVLKSANDESDRPSYLPARRDVYKEVGITQAEVEAYWQRRDESSQSFVDKFLFLAYPIALFVFIAICFSVYDSIVNPQTEYTASMTGTG